MAPLTSTMCRVIWPHLSFNAGEYMHRLSAPCLKVLTSSRYMPVTARRGIMRFLMVIVWILLFSRRVEENDALAWELYFDLLSVGVCIPIDTQAQIPALTLIWKSAMVFIV